MVTWLVCYVANNVPRNQASSPMFVIARHAEAIHRASRRKKDLGNIIGS